ncbi:MAG TPA: XRE family transcriptional regulator [Candidatus Krumholzibacteria bacterium]|nr:XRE family transcriptional regulator [Candidatus Krumholzibacteria bacterium]
MPTTELGERIKQLRLARNLTLKQVGEKAKVSATHLSEIERGRTSPTVGALVRIARALDQEPSQLVDDTPRPPVSIVRRAERRWWSSDGVTLAALSRGIRPDEISLLEVELTATDARPACVPGEAGEALVIVLEGGVDVDVAGKRHTLRTGDALHFGTHHGHTLYATAQPTRLLWISRPPVGM